MSAEIFEEQRLRHLYPQAFNDKRPPLVVGIHEVIKLPPGSEVLCRWVNHPTYLRNIIARKPRVALSGERINFPTFDQRLLAWDTLFRLRQARDFSNGYELAELARAMPKLPTVLA